MEEIHQRLLAGADEEVVEITRVLFFSGLTAAGFSYKKIPAGQRVWAR
jgi:hypothetical protein